MADTLLHAALALSGIAMLLALYRFLRGPTAADRVVAFDVLTTIAIATIALTGFIEGRGIYLDVALVYGLLSFLGVITVARYLERGF